MSSLPIASGPPVGWRGFIADWSSDRNAFSVSWGKAMMWIFLLSDTFIFGSFLTGYMTVRSSTTVAWPNPSEVFSLHIGQTSVPLLVIKTNVIMAMRIRGTSAPPMWSANTWLGFGHGTVVDMRAVM